MMILMDPVMLQPQVPKTFTFKFAVLIILLLVLGGVAYGAVWYWQKSVGNLTVPTFMPRPSASGSNLQIYTNQKYMYTISIPQNWSPEGGIFPDSSADHIAFLNSQSKVEINTVEDPASCSGLQSCIKSHHMQYNASGQTATNLNYLTVNGNYGGAESFSFNGIEDKTYYFYNNKTLYTLWFRTTTDEKSIIDPVLNQILSTFKFTK